MSVWKEYIDAFNSGDTDFLQNFDGDVGTFIELIKSKGLIKYLKVTPDMDAIDELKIVKAFHQSHMSSFIEFIEENLSDVKFENGVFYYVGEPENFSDLFGEGRNSLSNNTISKVLKGEADFDWYDNTTDDVYRDVVEELNKKNLEEFYKVVLYYSKDIKIHPHSELLEVIADSQGHPDYLYIDQENVERIVKDEESFKEILNEELSELKSNLSSLHYSSYNSAYENSLYNEVWDSLDNYFVVDQREWVSIPLYTGPNSHPKISSNIEKIKIPIRNLPEVVNEFIDANLDSTYPDSITYFGSFVSILHQVIDYSGSWVKVYPPDYPNSSEVEKNINEMFNDYVY